MATVTRIAFLCTHVQPFLCAGLKALLQLPGVHIMLIHWPPAPDAPLTIHPQQGLEIIERTPGTAAVTAQRLQAFDPQIIYGPGWMDKDYLRWIKACKKCGAACLMGMDNQWKGTPKQYLLSLLSRWTLRNIYTHAFVPGRRQAIYARRLGFKVPYILEGLCTPDTSLFEACYHNDIQQKAARYPRQFLYLGRLVAHKAGNLIEAFSSLSDDERRGWTLLLVGNGPLEHDPHLRLPHIRYHAYAPQSSLPGLIAQCGAGCLTSADEPWGTALQEMAAAGLPLMASHQCGASDQFVEDGVNGILCDGDSIQSIRAALLQMIDKSPEQLLEMAGRSHQLGVASTPGSWVKTVLSARN